MTKARRRLIRSCGDSIDAEATLDGSHHHHHIIITSSSHHHHIITSSHHHHQITGRAVHGTEIEIRRGKPIAC
jgi:hypothetical protein